MIEPTFEISDQMPVVNFYRCSIELEWNNRILHEDEHEIKVFSFV